MQLKMMVSGQLMKLKMMVSGQLMKLKMMVSDIVLIFSEDEGTVTRIVPWRWKLR